MYGESLQLCLTLCNPMDCGPPGSSVYGIPRARILDWVAISSSRGIFPTQGLNTHFLHCQVGSLPLQLVKSLSRVQLFATPWTVAYQAPLSMGSPRQKYWSGLPNCSVQIFDFFMSQLGGWSVSRNESLSSMASTLLVYNFL